MPTYNSYSQWSSGDNRGSRYSWAPALQKHFQGQNPGQQPSLQDRQQYAQSLGYRIRGDQAIGSHAGYETQTPLRFLQPPKPSMQGALRQDLFNAFGQDMQNIQGAADRQRARMMEQADLYESEYYGDIDAITEGYANAQGLMGGEIDRLEGRGDQAAANIRGAGDPGFDRAHEMYGESYDLAKGVATGDPGIDEAYQEAADLYAQDIDTYKDEGERTGYNLAAAQNRRAAMGRKLQGDQDRSGRGLSGGQQQALDTVYDREGAAQAAQAANETWARVNENVLQAKTTLGRMRQQIGDARGQEVSLKLSGIAAMEQAAAGTSQNASARAAVAREAEQARMAYDNLLTSTKQFMSGLMTQAPQVVAQLRAQGREFIAGIVERNPESVTSISQYLMAFQASDNAMRMGGGGGGGGFTAPSGGSPYSNRGWGTTKLQKGGGIDWEAAGVQGGPDADWMKTMDQGPNPDPVYYS